MGHGYRQQPLGHGQKKQGAGQPSDECRPDNGTKRNAASLECCQLMVMTEQPDGDNSWEQDKYRAELVNDKGNTEDEKLEDQAQRLPCLHEIVYFFKKIDENIDAGKASGNGAENSGELTQYVAV